jgi:hypothetical protein
MRKSKVCAIFAVVLLGATLMSAQATRTWVSGVGDDANPCSRTAPCKTWAGAIAKTVAGGEIDALDPGGFGALTITKPIILDGGGGQVASVLVAGTNGITVAAGSGDTVIIRNLRLDGLMCSIPAASGCTGSPGLTGISFISGKVLNIENVNIFGFSTSGINISLGGSASVNIVNSVIENIGTCTPGNCTNPGQGDGIFAKTTSGKVTVTVSNTQVMAASNNCMEASSNANIGAKNDVISNCNNGVATTGGTINIAYTEIAYNAANGYFNSSGPGIFVPSVNSVSSIGTNQVHDNGNTSSGTVTYVAQN